MGRLGVNCLGFQVAKLCSPSSPNQSSYSFASKYSGSEVSSSLEVEAKLGHQRVPVACPGATLPQVRQVYEQWLVAQCPNC